MEQLKGGRGFSFEHPVGAKSWEDPKMVCSISGEGVEQIVFDQCCFGLRDPGNGKYYRKRTRVATNNEQMVKLLDRQCNHDHDHQYLEGQVKIGGRWCNRTRCAQVYPKELVEAMIKAIRDKKKLTEQEVLAVEAFQEDKPDLKESVRRCHNNLGHPSKERFLHLLRVAGASEKALKIAKEFKCDICAIKNNPQMHPVTRSQRATGFNQQVCMDTFEAPIYDSKKLKFLNIVDEGTGMQVCIPMWKGVKSKDVRAAYRKYWLRWVGTPKRVLTDGGTEFDVETAEGFERDCTYVSKIAAESPLQNGMCERNGGIWKDVFQKGFEGCQPRNKKEVNELVDRTNESKNSMIRKHGYSPYQHVFGCDLRVRQSLVDRDMNVPYLSGMLHGVEGYERAQAIRQAARKAMVE